MKLPEGLSFDHVPELQTLWAELSELRLVLDGLPAPRERRGQEGLFAFWNRECERVTGYTSQEVLGNANVFDLLYPDPLQRARMSELRRNPGRGFRNVETELTTKYGSVKTVSWSSLSLTYPVDGWDAWTVGVDRTDARQNEEVLSLLAEVNSRLLQREPLDSIHSFICHRVAGIFRFALVSIGQRQNDGTVRMSGIAGPNAPGARPRRSAGTSLLPKAGSPGPPSGPGSSSASRPRATLRSASPGGIATRAGRSAPPSPSRSPPAAPSSAPSRSTPGAPTPSTRGRSTCCAA